MKVALVYSGQDEGETPDDADTLVQMRQISRILETLGHEAQAVPFNGSMTAVEKALEACAPEAVFNLVETARHTDRLSYAAAALFDYMGLPYTGCPAQALAMLSTKPTQKKLLKAAGLLTPEFWDEKEAHEAGALEGSFIVKPATENASVGIGAENVVVSMTQALALIDVKKRETGIKAWFVERYIEGREMNVAMLGRRGALPRLLPVSEILFTDFPQDRPRILDYAAKWDPDSITYRATVRSFEFRDQDKDMLQYIENIAIKCWTLFDLGGPARVDFRVDKNGNPWVLEVNPNPCLSSDAGFMAAAVRAGLSHEDVVTNLMGAVNG